MAAIDDLKAQRDQVRNEIDALVALRTQMIARHQAAEARIQARIDAARDRRQALTLAIRDLTDSWNPVL